MSVKEKLNIIVAETSPVISSGFAHTLKSLPFIQALVTEVSTTAELHDIMKTTQAAVVVVNPSFGGVFNPLEFREANKPDTKIVAIEIAKLDKNTLRLYDEVISIVDDFDTISAKIKKLTSGTEEQSSDKETLSQREKEIIALVVKGMTNKEVADTLFLSVHTVITHRRNIARKLEIHSATGLTIYAIVNHIVDISDIKL